MNQTQINGHSIHIEALNKLLEYGYLNQDKPRFYEVLAQVYRMLDEAKKSDITSDRVYSGMAESIRNMSNELGFIMLTHKQMAEMKVNDAGNLFMHLLSDILKDELEKKGF